MTESTGPGQTPALDIKSLGFWRSTWRLGPVRVVRSWDFLWAAALATGSSLAMVYNVEVGAQVDLAGDLVAVVAALLGVIIAGFAIVAALLGDRYTRLLQRSNTSTIGVLQHFLLIAGLMVASIIATLTFKTTAEVLIKNHHLLAEQILLGVMVFLFLWSLFYTIELIKLVLGVAVTSVEYQQRLDGDDPPGS